MRQTPHRRQSAAMELIELKKWANQIRVELSGRRLRWPKEFRSTVTKICDPGLPVREVSEALEIPPQTIRTWIYGRKHNSRRKTKNFNEVIVSDSRVSPIILRWEGGLEVSGLSFDQLKTLLKEGLL